MAGIGAEIVGFGISAISMALLPLILPLSTAIPLVAAVSVVATGIVAWHTKTKNLTKPLTPLLIGSVLGIPLGLQLLDLIPEKTLALLLGWLLVFAGSYSLLNGKKSKLKLKGWAGILIGILAGFFGASLNVNGPLVGMYSANNGRLSKYKNKDLIVTYMFITGLFVVAGHFLAGRLTVEVWKDFAFAMPGLGLGLWLGNLLFKKIKSVVLRQVIYLFVIIAGLALVF